MYFRNKSWNVSLSFKITIYKYLDLKTLKVLWVYANYINFEK